MKLPRQEGGGLCCSGEGILNNDRPCTRLSIEHEEVDDNAISLPITQNATSIPTALHYNTSYHATHALPLIPIRLSDPRISLDERTDGDKCAFVILHFLALSYTSFLMHFFIALLLIVRWPFRAHFTVVVCLPPRKTTRSKRRTTSTAESSFPILPSKATSSHMV